MKTVGLSVAAGKEVKTDGVEELKKEIKALKTANTKLTKKNEELEKQSADGSQKDGAPQK